MDGNRRHSQHARRALSQAHLLARDYQHREVDTDHLLVGILRQTDSVGAQILRELSIDARRAELEVRILHDIEDPLDVATTLSPALDRVLTLANEEARWFGHQHIGTEHLLLALTRNREGGIRDLLRRLNLSAEQIRRHIRTRIGKETSELDKETKRLTRLSELSRRALNAAKQLAGNGEAPGLAHLLLVLAQEHRSSTGQLLTSCELDCNSIYTALASAAQDSPMRISTLLDDILDHAANSADRLGMHYTGTEHILLAFAEHAEGEQILSAHGVTVSTLVTALYTNLQPKQG